MYLYFFYITGEYPNLLVSPENKGFYLPHNTLHLPLHTHTMHTHLTQPLPCRTSTLMTRSRLTVLKLSAQVYVPLSCVVTAFLLKDRLFPWGPFCRAEPSIPLPAVMFQCGVEFVEREASRRGSLGPCSRPGSGRKLQLPPWRPLLRTISHPTGEEIEQGSWSWEVAWTDV